MDLVATPFVHNTTNAAVHETLYDSGMDEKPPHYLREWREWKGLTQEALAEAVGTSKSQVSELERYNLQLSPKWLRRFAPVLGVQQGHIIDHHPDSLDSDIIDIWARIPQDRRRQAAKVLSAFVKTGTDDN